MAGNVKTSKTISEIVSENMSADLYEEYEVLLEKVASNKSSSQECVEFLNKLDECQIKPDIAQYICLRIREHFLNSEDAMDYLKGRLQIMQMREKDYDPKLVTDVHTLIADIYRKSSKILKAEEEYKAALELLPGDKYYPVKAVIYSKLSHFEYQKGGSDKSEEYFSLAESIVIEYLEQELYLLEEDILGRMQILVALATLADLRRMQKNYEDVEKFFKLSLAVAEKCNEIEVCRSCSWLVQACFKLDKEDEMLKFVLKTNDIILKIKDNPEKFRGTTVRRIIRHLDRVCFTLFWSDNVPRSIKFYLEAQALAEKYFGQDHPVTGMQFATIALCYIQNGDEHNYEKYKKLAEDFLERISLSLEDADFLSLYIDELAVIHYDMGLAHERKADYSKAEAYLDKGLRLVKQFQSDAPMRQAKWHKLLGRVCRSQKKFEDCLNHLQICLQLNQDQEVQNMEEISFLKNLMSKVKSQHRTASLNQHSNFSPSFRNGRRSYGLSPRSKSHY